MRPAHRTVCIAATEKKRKTKKGLSKTMGKSSNPTFAGDKEFEKIHLKEKFSYGLGDVA